MAVEFADNKKKQLQGLDLSRKGSVDTRIEELINYINDIDCYCTSSSCSGRITVFSHTADKQRKKGCIWLLVSHEIVESSTIIEALKDNHLSAVLKFESFILHVQCATLLDAQKLHSLSIESGFRNSGITVSKAGKITLAVRSTLSLEVPLSKDGILLVSHEYIDYIVEKANGKMEENWSRLKRFNENIQKLAKFSELQEGEKRKKSNRKGQKHIAVTNKTESCNKRDKGVETVLSNNLVINQNSTQDEIYDGLKFVFDYK